MVKYFLSVLGIFFFCIAGAQTEAVLVPLTGNPSLKNRLQEQPHLQFVRKTGIKDTLLLPFFDDFSKGEVFPDSLKWTNKLAYINTDFPVSPPSVGVATLDALDSTGKPYLNIRADLFGGCDTLTSQPIDLSAYNTGNNIFLSFFYQAQGLSFFQLASKDSLVLQFKKNNGGWYNVWSSPGIPLTDFKPALVPFTDPGLFHGGFQFRFINYQNYIGGAGQWHIDYVYIERNRTAADSLFNDVAIGAKPASLLKDYQEMPYTHYKGFETQENRIAPLGHLSNLGGVGRTVDIFNRLVWDVNNNNIFSSSRTGIPIDAYDDSAYEFSPGIFATFPQATDSVTYNVAEYLKITGANTSLVNDSFVRRLNFANYFAYDDGTAETGFALRGGPGKVAYQFRLNKPDTLRAISVYFYQAEDTVKKPFVLTVWKSITPGANTEEVLYRQVITAPVYTDSINGYYTFVLDTPVFVQNNFYIGWAQSTTFLLNVGWDRNYTSNGQQVPNPALYFNTTGRWNTSFIPGTMMMRPHVGKSFSLDTATLHVEPVYGAKNIITVYPNPATTQLSINLPQHGEYTYEIHDLGGKTVQKGELNSYEQSSVDIALLTNGLYFIILQNSKLGTHYAKFVKQ